MIREVPTYATSRFTCDRELPYDDGYFFPDSMPPIVAPVCDECRIRHAQAGPVRTGYLIEDRIAHGLPATGGRTRCFSAARRR